LLPDTLLGDNTLGVDLHAEPAPAACATGEFIHDILDDVGARGIKGISRFASLEEGIRILRGATQYRVLGSHAPRPMRGDLRVDRVEPDDLFLELLVALGREDDFLHVVVLLDPAQKRPASFQRRPAGAELVVPCVVHWKLNHYAAILQEKNGRYLVEDPTFERQILMDAGTIDAESSGEFILPKDKVPASWQKLTAAECAAIYGKGYPNAIGDSDDDGPPGACGGGDGSDDSDDSTCDPPSSNDGARQGGPPPPPTCPDCGMPQWSVSEPYCTLWLEDVPVRYVIVADEEVGSVESQPLLREVA